MKTMQFSAELANKIVDDILYATSVTYDGSNNHVVRVTAVYFDIENKGEKEQASKPVYLNRENIFWLLDNGYRLLAMPQTQEEIPISEIIQYVNPQDGQTYLTTRLAATPRDNLYPIPRTL